MSRSGVNEEEVIKAKLPTRYGDFDLYGFENESDGEQAVALVMGDLSSSEAPLVRIHSQCFTGDTLHSLRCDCGDQLEQALSLISTSGPGILIYQMQEGRGIGLINKLRAYQLQDRGVDTVEANLQLGFEADLRSYRFCAEILKYLGVNAVRLLSNNPDKINGLEEAGVKVVERVPSLVDSSQFRQDYMQTKKEKMGHLL